ncbi:ABC transporter substrate-binding protein [Arthrobacter castelli]|uniref:ABC transporter substrate-binding protein n=1 Tax=Arthrobacter castelli TaxID=271431 RepID=UPI0004155170|nr:ABC transporter substrate-binding protein [Arthrobacter castelli]
MATRQYFRHTVLTAGLAASLLLTGCGGSNTGSTDEETAGAAPLADMLPTDVRDEGTIVAGGLMDVPPVGFYDSAGEPTGVNPDLAELFEEQLGIEIKFRKLSFSGLRPALQSGKIDIIWDSMNDTVERQKVLDFIDYLGAGYTMLVPAGNPNNLQTLADLCGMSMATIRGAAQIDAVNAQSEKCTEAGKKPINLKLYGAASDARLQVKTGRVEAFIGNAPALLYLASNEGSGSTFDAVTLKNQGKSYYGIGFNKSDTQLRKAFTAALSAVIKDGSYDKVLEGYGLNELGVEKAMTNAVGK